MIAPGAPTDYHRLHVCRSCESVHVLAVVVQRGAFFVVTRCRCDIYSTEAGPFQTRAAAERAMRWLYVGQPAGVAA